MKKIPFTKLPIYAAIRRSKLSRRTQDEVLRKLKKYYATGKANFDECNDWATKTTIAAILDWAKTKEGRDYWSVMHRDSGL